MKLNKKERSKLLNGLRKKTEEQKKAGRSGVVPLNVPPKPKRPKIVKQQSVLDVLKKTSQSSREKSLDTILEGIVKWFNINRGYGFIVGEDKKEYFAHHSNIIGKTTERSLTEGDKVRFEFKSTDRGLSAIKITKQESK